MLWLRDTTDKSDEEGFLPYATTDVVCTVRKTLLRAWILGCWLDV